TPRPVRCHSPSGIAAHIQMQPSPQQSKGGLGLHLEAELGLHRLRVPFRKGPPNLGAGPLEAKGSAIPQYRGYAMPGNLPWLAVILELSTWCFLSTRSLG